MERLLVLNISGDSLDIEIEEHMEGEDWMKATQAVLLGDIMEVSADEEVIDHLITTAVLTKITKPSH